MKFQIQTGHPQPSPLPMTGVTLAGDVLGINSEYFTKNGKPVLPVMGEFHFSRWHPDQWEESLRKMKAGGITVVANYVIWIHHEEKQGEWDFSGCRNLSAFLALCRKVGLDVWLRLGPWVHGECRNGGFPDWMAHAPFPTRTDSPEYLACVHSYWSRVAEQTRGMMCSEGGPVIGFQLENEYGHCGGPADKNEGLAHMKTLRSMAQSLGLTAPYYTATAWGGAYVVEGETLPVYGGYVDAPWAQHTDELPASENFLFIPYRDDTNVGSDLRQGEASASTVAVHTVPYLSAELGSGLQVTAHRRTFPYPEDVEAQSLCFIGAGANLIGYYMYHGGYNPEGRYSTLQESRATGYLNDLPVKSYDFQTCIRESGELNESYHRLRKLHLMIADFQELLAPARVCLPDQMPVSAEDMDTVRACVRYHEESGTGFLFVNGHQRKRTMKSHENWGCEVVAGERTMTVSGVNVRSGQGLVIPFGLKLTGGTLVSTNASLLCRLGEWTVFYTDDTPVYRFEGSEGKVLTLTRKEADRAYKFGDTLWIADCVLYEKDGAVCAVSARKEENLVIIGADGMRSTIKVNFPQPEGGAVAVSPAYGNDPAVYTLNLTLPDVTAAHEIYLHLDYQGDRAELYQDGKLRADWFTNGETWHVALKRFGCPTALELRIYPSVTPVYYDLDVTPGCSLTGASLRTDAVIRLDPQLRREV